MKRTFQYGEETFTLEITPEGDSFRVRLPDGTEQVIQARRLGNGGIEIRHPDVGADPRVCPPDLHKGRHGGLPLPERILRIPVSHPAKDTIYLLWQGETYTFAPITEGNTGRAAAKQKRSGALTAPMVGVVAAVHVSSGDTVTAYQPLVVVEAMKVLATLEAPFAGVVQSVGVRKGDRVEHGAVLVEITPQPESTPEATR